MFWLLRLVRNGAALHNGAEYDGIFQGQGDNIVIPDAQGASFDSTSTGKFTLDMPPSLNGGLAYTSRPNGLPQRTYRPRSGAAIIQI